MTPKEEIKEIAMISAIISNVIFDKLYEKTDIGYIAVTDMIADWAIEFFEKHKDTNWGDVMDGTMKPLSTVMNNIICWDDCIMDFAEYKFSQI